MKKTPVSGLIVEVFILSSVLFTCQSHLWGASLHQDPAGRFSIDLPDGFVTLPQEQENLIVFNNPAESLSVNLVFYPGGIDLDRPCADRLQEFRYMVKDSQVEGSFQDLTVNGNRARWGAYRGHLTGGELSVEVHALVGCVLLKQGALSFRAVVNEEMKKKSGPGLEPFFKSIREVGAAVDPASPPDAPPKP